jgi:hypothetical protein
MPHIEYLRNPSLTPGNLPDPIAGGEIRGDTNHSACI